MFGERRLIYLKLFRFKAKSIEIPTQLLLNKPNDSITLSNLYEAHTHYYYTLLL